MNCLECGNDLTGKWQKKYCSHPCAVEHLRKERRSASEAKRRRVCVSCGKEFIMGHMSAKASRGEIKAGLYCSRKCRWKAERKPEGREQSRSCRVHIGKCGICGTLFTSRLPRARCGRSCDLEYERRRSREANAAKKVIKKRKCKECGRMFVAEYGDKHKAFCSEVCMHRNLKRRRRQKERAILRSARVETVDAIRVFERDNWRCQLCGRKLRQAHRGTVRDDAPELDHIIPLSKGGEHSCRNTQCSCRKCNQDKGGTEIGQLRLFG